MSSRTTHREREESTAAVLAAAEACRDNPTGETLKHLLDTASSDTQRAAEWLRNQSKDPWSRILGGGVAVLAITQLIAAITAGSWISWLGAGFCVGLCYPAMRMSFFKNPKRHDLLFAQLNSVEQEWRDTTDERWQSLADGGAAERTAVQFLGGYNTENKPYPDTHWGAKAANWGTMVIAVSVIGATFIVGHWSMWVSSSVCAVVGYRAALNVFPTAMKKNPVVA